MNSDKIVILPSHKKKNTSWKSWNFKFMEMLLSRKWVQILHSWVLQGKRKWICRKNPWNRILWPTESIHRAKRIYSSKFRGYDYFQAYSVGLFIFVRSLRKQRQGFYDCETNSEPRMAFFPPTLGTLMPIKHSPAGSPTSPSFVLQSSFFSIIYSAFLNFLPAGSSA